MHFEDLLKEIGSFGKYQRRLCFLLIPFTTGFVAMTYYSQLLILAVPSYTCNQVGVEGEGDTYQQRLSELLNSTPYEDEARQPYNCHQFDLNLTWPDPGNVTWLDPDNVTSLAQLPAPSLPCENGWVYDYDVFFSTYSSEHDWVCGEAWRPYLVVTIFWVGNTVGSWVWGSISDLYGRRVAVVWSMVVYGVAGVASAFVSNFSVFTILRFLVGSSHHTVSHLPFVLVVEYCGLESRVVPLLTIMASYTIFSLATPALAWLIWSWPTLVIIPAISCLALPLTYRWIPESASWLIARGRGEDARRQLQQVAKVNGRQLPQEMVTRLLTEGESREDASKGLIGSSEDVVKGKDKNSTQSIVKAVKYPGLRKNILLVLLIWMLACMCYYGHCQNTAHLGGSVLVSYLLGTVVEVPSWCVPWIIHRFGRRVPLIVVFLISSVAGFIYAIVPRDVEWLVLALGLLGRASITGAYYISLQYGPEIFPTVVRGQGVALAETLAGIAIFLSPLIVYLGEYERTAPLQVFAGLSVVGGAATLLLPETGGVVLPQTLAQAEDFARKTPTCCRSKSSKREPETREDSTREAQV